MSHGLDDYGDPIDAPGDHCDECGCPGDEHDAPEFGGGCTRCGDCDGFR